MNVNNLPAKCAVAAALTFMTLSCLALDSRSQSKVSNAMAKKWSSQDSGKDGYQVQQDQSVVNIGSKRGGDCVVNIGTVQKGAKAPKEIVVTTKEVINVCK
jgi:hypothetical protein